jgi:hypothetical protein
MQVLPLRNSALRVGFCTVFSSDPDWCRRGAQDRARSSVLALGSSGLEINIFCVFRYSFLLHGAIVGLDLVGPALCRPQVPRAGGARLVPRRPRVAARPRAPNLHPDVGRARRVRLGRGLPLCRADRGRRRGLGLLPRSWSEPRGSSVRSARF